VGVLVLPEKHVVLWDKYPKLYFYWRIIMFTGAWKALVEIIYNTTGSLFVGVYLYALLTLIEIISLSVIIMHIAEKIRTRKRKR
jgi:hypothetical protein